MPVDATELDRLLRISGYEDEKRQFVVNGFTNGFDLCYEGDKFVKRTAANLRLRVDNKFILWNKLMKEVQLNRVVGNSRKFRSSTLFSHQ